MSNKITCNNYIYQDGDIRSGSCYLGNSLAAEELSIDTLDAEIAMGETTFQPSGSDGFESSDGTAMTCSNPVSAYAYGDKVNFEHDDALVGKFYFEKLKRKSLSIYALSTISAMGLLDNMMHYGGIYIGVTAGTVIASIMGDIPYTISDVAAAVIFNNGYLPVDTCRNNLQQVLFAIGAGVFKDSNGDILIKFIASGTPEEIPSSRIYIDGSVDYKTPCTEVDVTEHTYRILSSDETVTLLDTSEILSSQRIAFDDPCHGLAVTGSLTIEESGVNYAIVSGAGKLTGKKYTHTKKVLAYRTGISGAENVVSVTDATLVSVSNSYNVARRVAQYYSAVSTVSVGIVMSGERPADEIKFSDPFGDPVSGYIKDMSITLSGILKSDTNVAIGFIPSGQGNNFKHYIILESDGTWTVPEGVDLIKAVAIGAGYDGQSGSNGSSGSDSASCSASGGGSSSGAAGAGGNGGDGGAGGSAGRILELDNAAVTPGQSFSVSVGQSNGADSSFNGHSTADGASSTGGYSNAITGEVYALPGADGNAGAKGGDGGEVSISSSVLNNGSAGESVSGNSGGAAGKGDYFTGGSAVSYYTKVADGTNSTSFSVGTYMSGASDASFNSDTGAFTLIGTSSFTITANGPNGTAYSIENGRLKVQIVGTSGVSGATSVPGYIAYYRANPVYSIAYGKNISGGGGGAAAYSNDGNPGELLLDGTGTRGKGGAGANATPKNASTVYGCGGDGGNGGGGGGGGGGTAIMTASKATTQTCIASLGGTGGSGGSGGAGAPGCVIIYY